MLIDITIKNYLSFKEEVTFSLLGNTSKDLPDNFFSYKKDKILKTAVIYGSNASGKTNLLRAINLVKRLVVEGFRMGPNEQIVGYPDAPLSPFRLSLETRSEPSEFEINFIVKEIPYRYKFSLNNSVIISEELYSRRTQKEKKLYTRSFQNIDLFDFDDNQSKNRVLENTLAISVFAKENSSEAKEIHNFFSNIYVFFSETTPIDTIEMLKQDDFISEDKPKFKPFLIEFLKKSDTGINDIDYKISKTPLPMELRSHLVAMQQPLPLEIDSFDFMYIHSIYDKFHNKVGSESFSQFNISEGTKKMFEWAGTIFNVINEGKILFIDEIDRSLHPMLQEKIIESFHKTSSSKPFQIVFTTHNVKLMDIQDIFRRDQVWFVDKNSYGESKISSLLEFKDKTRKDLILERNYYKGRYGGIPNLNTDNLFSN